MEAAAINGDAKRLAELMRQDPGFNVNQQDGYGFTLLHSACLGVKGSAVIPLLLAHPGINVNLMNRDGATPFFYACRDGYTSRVREMLKDSRVKVNEPGDGGYTPLCLAAVYSRLDVIKWWIASGREMDLGESGDYSSDAIGRATKNGQTEVVTLLERFKENPVKTRHQVRLQIGWCDEAAAEMFALVVFVSDGLLQIKNLVDSTTPAASFFRIASLLPLELQMVLCFRVVWSAKEIISGKDSEVAFRCLARRI